MELSDGLRVILKGHLDWGQVPIRLFYRDVAGLIATEAGESDATGAGFCEPV